MAARRKPPQRVTAHPTLGCERAAWDFVTALFPDERRFELRWHPAARHAPVIRLVLAAYLIYEADRRNADVRIRDWREPYRELEREEPFARDHKPWNVLLRRAWELAQDARENGNGDTKGE